MKITFKQFVLFVDQIGLKVAQTLDIISEVIITSTEIWFKLLGWLLLIAGLTYAYYVMKFNKHIFVLLVISSLLVFCYIFAQAWKAVSMKFKEKDIIIIFVCLMVTFTYLLLITLEALPFIRALANSRF